MLGKWICSNSAVQTPTEYKKKSIVFLSAFVDFVFLEEYN